MRVVLPGSPERMFMPEHAASAGPVTNDAPEVRPRSLAFMDGIVACSPNEAGNAAIMRTQQRPTILFDEGSRALFIGEIIPITSTGCESSLMSSLFCRLVLCVCVC